MESIIGKKFNRLTVLEHTGCKTKSRSKIYTCKCDCGNIVQVAGPKLRHGTKSCGCLKAENIKQEIGKKRKNYTGVGDLSGVHWNRILFSAKIRKKEFSITKEYAWNLFLLQGGRCAISGEKILLSDKSADTISGKVTASLDRIDSTKGYIEGNVQWLHKDVNYMKWKMSTETLLTWCDRISIFNKTRRG
jgi:hypothetical protein